MTIGCPWDESIEHLCGGSNIKAMSPWKPQTVEIMFDSSAIAPLESHEFHLIDLIKVRGCWSVWTQDVKQQPHCHLQLNAVKTQNLATELAS